VSYEKSPDYGSKKRSWIEIAAGWIVVIVLSVVLALWIG